MNKPVENPTLQALANQYQAEGYQVIVNPNVNEIPFDLEGYRPDLLAIKDDLKLIIQSRKGLKRYSIERMQAVAQLIAQHDGWHFIIVTLDDMLEDNELDAEKIYLTWEEITRQTSQVPLIIQSIGNNAALLYIWGICEAVLRRYALEAAIPVERLPIHRVINYFYTIGELSMTEMDTLLAIYKQRHKVAHGFKIDVNRDTLEQLSQFIHKALHEWTAVA
jgi:hypothetical protein